MAGRISGEQLAACVRVERRSASGSHFLLDISLEIGPGITILFGPSGSGKSTLLDCLAGLFHPDEGRIAIGADTLFDVDGAIDVPPRQRHIGYVFQTLALFPHMSVEDNVAFGISNLPRPQRHARVAEALRSFRVDQLATRKPAQISGGERQRVALARSLVTLPRVLLLDEPLAGLDAGLKVSIIDDLRAWNATHKIPILYVTHSREEVDALGEHVIAMDSGKIIGEGAPREVLDAPRRATLAQALGFENLFAGTVVELRESDGVMRVHLADSPCVIEVPLGYAKQGDRVRIAIRAGDILLAAQHPSGLSARNVLEGKITLLERRGSIVVVRVDCGIDFIVHVTPGAERALRLAPGKLVWLVLKTHSCHLVAE